MSGSNENRSDDRFDRTLTVSLEYPTRSVARIVFDSIAVEVDELEEDRARTSVRIDDRTVTITVEATDTVALRAGSNSWFRLASAAEAAIGAVD